MGLIEQEGNRRLWLGRILEPLVLQEFADVTGFETATTDKEFFHKKHTYIKGHIDAFIPNQNIGIEIKTANEYAADLWKDSIPDEYMIQVQHYMAVTGFDAFYVAAWIGFREFVYHRVERDQELIDQIIQTEVDFWNNYILTKSPPMVGALDNSILNKTLNANNQNTIPLSNDMEIKLDTLMSIKTHIGFYETKKNELEAIIKLTLGENTEAENNKYKVSWTPNKNGIRLLKIKEK